MFDCWERQVQGLAAFLLSVKKNPIIRYQQRSSGAQKLARDLSALIEQEAEVFGWSQPTNPPLLLIVDRREDPITPLLTQWTYQAMVHELLGIANSRVRLPRSADEEEEKKYAAAADEDVDDPSRWEVVLNPFDDEFFAENLTANYGEIADITQKRLQAFAKKKASVKTGIKTIEDMQRFVENFPDFMSEQGSVVKHLNVVSALRDIVGARKLLDVSRLEQEIVCEPSSSTSTSKKHFNELEIVIKNPSVAARDKLRLAMIYLVRYESKLTETRISKLRSLLRDACMESELSAGDLDMLSAVLRHYGVEQRQSALFAHEEKKSGGLLGRLGSLVKSQVEDVECIYTQHNPLLAKILDQAVGGKLSLTDYPSTSGRVNPSAFCFFFVVVLMIFFCV